MHPHSLTHCNGIDVNMIKTKWSNIQHHGIKEQNVNSPSIMYSKYMPFSWFTIPKGHPTSLCWFLWTLQRFKKINSERFCICRYNESAWAFNRSSKLSGTLILFVVAAIKMICFALRISPRRRYHRGEFGICLKM